MAQNYAATEVVAGKVRRTRTGLVVGSGGFTDQEYDVGEGGQTAFVVSAGFESGTKMDVWVNGIMMREGVGHDYTRNAATDTVTTTFTVPKDSYVRVRVYTI